MTKDIMEDLLDGYIKMTEDLQDLQANGIYINELIRSTEGRMDDIGTTLNGLEQNLQQLDQKFIVVESWMRTTFKREIIGYIN